MYQAPTSGASVDPIISRLRPRSVGEILDQAFRLYRRYFLIFIGIIAIVVVPLQLAQQIIAVFLVGGLSNYEENLISTDFSSNTGTSSINEMFTFLGVLGGLSIVIGL